MQLSGSVSTSLSASAPLTTTSAAGLDRSGVWVGVTPGFGIFVANHFALQFDLTLSGGVGTSYSSSPFTVGADVGIGVYPTLGSFGALYVRVLAGPSYSSYPATSGLSAYSGTAFSLSVPFGILIALNQHVGLDLGMRLNLTVRFYPGSSMFYLNLPVGYFGVQAFF